MIPTAFQRVHPRFGTPHIGILFILVFCLVAPWAGRTALSWIVDMASIGFTFAFLYTCLCAFRIFRWSGETEVSGVSGAYSTTRKLMAAAGAAVAVGFMAVLLIPGSPGQLSGPSMLAMGVWIAVGVVFFLLRYRHNRTLTDDEVDQAVLDGPRPESLRRVRANP